MAERILIRPSPQAERCSWRLLDGADGGTVGHGDLAAAAAAAAGRPATVLVPGTETLLTRVRLPVRSRSRARAAIPWALEERLAQDVEELHFALGSVADGEWPVAVVAHAWLADLLARCEAAGLAVDVVVPEPLALPEPMADQWQALETGGQVVVRMDADTGFACETDLLAVVAAAETPPEVVHVQRVADARPAAWPDTFTVGDAIPITGDPLVACTAADPPRLNLLQGVFSRREKNLERLRAWRLPAALAAALVLLSLVEAGISHVELGQRQVELEERVQALYRDTFPDARATQDPRAQMRSRLQALRGGGSGDDSRFTDMMLAAGEVISGRDGARMVAAEWRNGTLDLDVEADQLAELDAIQRGLGDRGMSTELSSVDRDGERVSGRLRVREGAS